MRTAAALACAGAVVAACAGAPPPPPAPSVASAPFVRPAEWRGEAAGALALQLGVFPSDAAEVVEARRQLEHMGALVSVQFLKAPRPHADGLCAVQVVSVRSEPLIFSPRANGPLAPGPNWRAPHVYLRWYAPDSVRAGCSALSSPALAFRAPSEAEARSAVGALRSAMRRAGSPGLRLECQAGVCSDPAAALRTLAASRLSSVGETDCRQETGRRCFFYAYHPFGPVTPGLQPPHNPLVEWRVELPAEADPPWARIGADLVF